MSDETEIEDRDAPEIGHGLCNDDGDDREYDETNLAGFEGISQRVFEEGGISCAITDNNNPILQSASILNHAFSRNLKKVKEILAKEPNSWQERGVDGITSYMVAATNNDEVMLKALYTHNIEGLFLHDLHFDDAITCIIGWDNINVLNDILDKKPDLLQQRSGLENNTYGHIAAQTGRAPVLEWMMRHHPQILTEENVLGQTLTEFAALYGRGKEGIKTLSWLAKNHPETFHRPNSQTGTSPFTHIQNRRLAEIALVLIKPAGRTETHALAQ
jgi:hypothetical protein